MSELLASGLMFSPSGHLCFTVCVWIVSYFIWWLVKSFCQMNKCVTLPTLLYNKALFYLTDSYVMFLYVCG